jgi:NADH-quinone oxidoreductase subunit J
MLEWIQLNRFLLEALALTGLGVWWLMPSTWPRWTWGGVVLALVGCGMLASRYPVTTPVSVESILFWIFAAAALVCAVMMITSRNPVYAALWFALVTLSTCGLFLLQSAPFLAAATIVVYAGAIVVTFLFVMMLAQQRGETFYDQRARQPLAATVVAFVLLGALLYTIQMWGQNNAIAEAQGPAATVTVSTNELSRPPADAPIGTVHELGRSLFGDYLFAVELAGTLLLIASIGAIAMAPRRPEGTL